MNYEEKYNQALERARGLHDNHPYGEPLVWTTCEKIFPELKESEDEKIRNEMIDFMSLQLKALMPSCPSNDRLETWIAWLEKQGEQKSAWSEDDESMYTRTLGILGKCYMGQLPTKVEEELNWLKYRLKYIIQQDQWKPSKEQIRTLEYYMHNLVCSEHKEVLFGLYEQLKKLKGE